MYGEKENPQDTYTIEYIFTFKNKEEKAYKVLFDNKTMFLLPPDISEVPSWAKLSDVKCSPCSLDQASNEYCPLLLRLLELIAYFKDKESTEEVEVNIKTAERNYQKKVSLQVGLSSLMGIYMVSSGCPVFEKLKPMVRYHLPFATTEETTYRVVTMYLMAQFFRKRQGQQPDWDLKGLEDIYKQVQAVNNNICDVIRQIISKDASINALIKLDCFAFHVFFNLSENILTEIASNFNAYLSA